MKTLKHKIIIFISIFVLFILTALIFVYKDQKIAVLGYHSFISHKNKFNYQDPMILDIDKFEEQIKYLKNHNYKTLSLEEFYCWKNKKCKIPRKSVLITMDDGYLSNYYLAFPILKKYDMKATVFYVGSYINDDNKEWNDDPKEFMSFEDIENAKKEYPNIEFASHSYDLHKMNDVENMTYDELVNDINKYKKINDSKFFAYPFGNYNDKIESALKNNGYKMAFTFGPKENHRKATLYDNNYRIPRLNISDDMSYFKFKLRLILPF